MARVREPAAPSNLRQAFRNSQGTGATIDQKYRLEGRFVPK